jgi:hypothetical protein
MQGIIIMEPILSKAARKLSLDQVDIRRANCPEGKAPWGPERDGKRAHSKKRSIAAPSSSNGRNESRVPSGAAPRCAELACRRAHSSPVLPVTTDSS